MEPTDRGTRVEADEIVPGAPERMKLPELPELPWNLFGIFLFVLLILTAVGFLRKLQAEIRSKIPFSKILLYRYLYCH